MHSAPRLCNPVLVLFPLSVCFVVALLHPVCCPRHPTIAHTLLLQSPILSHTHSLFHTHTHTHSLSHSHTLSLTLSLSHSLAHSPSHSPILMHNPLTHHVPDTILCFMLSGPVSGVQYFQCLLMARNGHEGELKPLGDAVDHDVLRVTDEPAHDRCIRIFIQECQ